MSLESIASIAQQLWLVWLFLLFVGIIFFAVRPKNKERFEEAAMIPLRDDDQGD